MLWNTLHFWKSIRHSWVTPAVWNSSGRWLREHRDEGQIRFSFFKYIFFIFTIYSLLNDCDLNDCDWKEDGIFIDGNHLTHLAYADDVVLIARSKPAMIRMLETLKNNASTCGLSLNAKKTMILSNFKTTRTPIIIRGEKFEFVDQASYLGITVSFPLNPSEEVNRRIRCAWGAWGKIHDLMISPRLTLEHKRRAFESLITPAVLYGAELWSLQQSDKERLGAAQRKMERKILGVTLLHRWSNERIKKCYETERLGQTRRKEEDWLGGSSATDGRIAMD